MLKNSEHALVRILGCLALGVAWLAGSGWADDAQLWLNQSIRVKLADDWQASVAQEFRFTDGMADFTVYFVEGGASGRLSSWFDVGMFYRQQYERSSGRWLEENRPYVEGTLRWKWADIPFSDRNRIEYRVREDRTDMMRYRNRLMIESPKRWTQWKICPYAADEIFIDSDAGELNRNRVYVGVKAQPLSWLTAEVYGLWEASKTGNDWASTHVLGVKTGFAF